MTKSIHALRGMIATVAAVALILPILGCSDNDPVAPTGGGASSRAYVSASAGDWVVEEFYSPEDPFFGFPEETYWIGTLDLSDVFLKDVSAGDRIIVRYNFVDPLRLIRDVRTLAFQTGRGGGLVAEMLNMEVTVTGDWQLIRPGGTLYGDGSGVLTGSLASSVFESEPGAELSSLAIEFTIPERYNSGLDVAETPTLSLQRFQWIAWMDGDHRGAGAPVEVVE